MTAKFRYVGQCDRLRRAPEGESRWRAMMTSRRPIALEALATRVDLSKLLDDGEVAGVFLADARRADPSTAAFASRWGDRPAAFLQTSGFEFVFAGPRTRRERR